MENKLDAARKIINEVDSQMAELFVKRMRAAEMVFEYKMEYDLPILDQKREDTVIAKNAALIEDKTIQGYYIDFLKNLMALSRAYQYQMQKELKVAYSLGSADAAHMTAEKMCPESTKVACRDLQTAYDSVISGECDIAPGFHGKQ